MVPIFIEATRFGSGRPCILNLAHVFIIEPYSGGSGLSGIDGKQLGLVREPPDEIRRRLAEAIAQVEAACTSGAMRSAEDVLRVDLSALA